MKAFLSIENLVLTLTELDAAAAALAETYDTLSPEAKPAVLKAGHALSSLRQIICKQLKKAANL